MKKKIYHYIASSLLIFSGFSAEAARNQIRIVGSSTVYPFVTVAAEQFAKKANRAAPVVESTGTGGGFKIFCEGVGDNYPDIVNASRAIKTSEREECLKNNISEPLEIVIGMDALVLAHSIAAQSFSLSKRDVYLATAEKLINDNGEIVSNPYTHWNQINASLPNIPILIYGPPPSSGTRDSFISLIVEPACRDSVGSAKKKFLKEEEYKVYEKQCHILRHDGKFVEVSENDNIILQKISVNKGAVGIFGFGYLEENRDIVKAIAIDAALPTMKDILNGVYTISRPLFVYFKKEHFGKIPSLHLFMKELVSEDTIGDNGYLLSHYLIPATSKQRKQNRKKFSQIASTLKLEGKK